MGILSAQTLRSSLQKARGVGIVEERFSLDDCEVVVRNLRPDEYESILADCQKLEDMAYLNMFQKGHVSRALVELNGQDLRDVQFIDDEEPDPKRPGQTKTVKLELHKWLENNVLSTWGKEAIYVAYRKVSDAVERAEGKSKDGIKFLTPDETPEEKYRRLIGELLEVQGDVPRPIVDKVLDESGFMLKSTAEEAKRAMDAADALAREQIAKEKAATEEREKAATEERERLGVAILAVTPPLATSTHPSTPTPSEIMQKRVPLNQSPVEIDTAAQRVASVVPATRQPAQPTPEATPTQDIQGHQLVGSAALRSAQMAALEADADTVGALADGPPPGFDQATRSVPVLERRLERGDPRAAMGVIDQPPRVGLNPHFRTPRKV